MKPTVLLFAGLFLLVDAAMWVKMIWLLKKMKDNTAEDLGNK